MKILCDENVKHSILTLLEQEGHDVVRVQDELDLGFADAAIVEHCRETDRALLTNDDDFFDFEEHPGVFFVTDQGAHARDVVTAIQRIERTVGSDSIGDQVWHVPDGWI